MHSRTERQQSKTCRLRNTYVLFVEKALSTPNTCYPIHPTLTDPHRPIKLQFYCIPSQKWVGILIAVHAAQTINIKWTFTTVHSYISYQVVAIGFNNCSIHHKRSFLIFTKSRQIGWWVRNALNMLTKLVNVVIWCTLQAMVECCSTLIPRIKHWSENRTVPEPDIHLHVITFI